MAISITNTAGKKFTFDSASVTNMTISTSMNIINFPIPGDDEDSNVVLNVGGKAKLVSFQFKLFDSTGTDRADGTHTSSIETIKEQINYITDTVISTDIDEEFTLVVDTDLAENLMTKQGLIDSISMTFDPQNPTYVTGSVTFKIGANPIT